MHLPHPTKRTPANPGLLTSIFIDESSQTKHRYLAVGALAINNNEVSRLEDLILEARRPELPKGEIAWVKVSKTKLPAYKRVIDVFFDRQTSPLLPLQFHMAVSDTHQFKDKLYNKGSREIGFNKEIFLIARKCGQLYPQRLFHVFPDARTTPSKPEDLRFMLNRDFAKRGDPRDWPYRRLHFRNSADSQILQLTDVLLGSVMYQINGHHKALDASPAKLELSQYICAKAGVSDVARGTGRTGKFTVWHRKLR